MSEDFSIYLVEAEKAKTYILDAINQGIELCAIGVKKLVNTLL
ncbi:hypothetical protein [Crocosphaera sp.]|nr:hypothetical protein [Crocosphaera sp.]MDJ0581034.1 hypothetical protein [Crocosphaera sp.]